MSVSGIMSYIWVIFWAYWLLSGLETRSKIKKEKSGENPLYRIVHVTLEAFSILIVIVRFNRVLIWKEIIAGNSIVDFVGLIIVFVGLMFSIWAKLVLGKNWSGAIQKVEKQELVKSGPYKYIRHPIYTGIIVGLIGSLIINRNFSSLFAVIIVTVLYIVKVNKEQKFLIKEFGEQYTEYIKKSWALFPLIY
ncbi:isoprenylcysteine carboxylmethyltransferase family protein [Bacillus methanolicus]|uniref:methyltransferase family protein n=1 Tax=Bacillus methanolicus TaxID=1471 RepID=UPI00200F8FED|nr:isoprenylcysteine carboxylmethyltransferase family protein [Bacillus methanolicus]UQD50993.1 isoprenylcysteine carboxylmethyltransferase family protein [Bacillus methanolicus]